MVGREGMKVKSRDIRRRTASGARLCGRSALRDAKHEVPK
jgi:hypothetical protein